MFKTMMIGAALGALFAFTPAPARAGPFDCSSLSDPGSRSTCRDLQKGPCSQDPTCFTPPDGAGPHWYG
jgi:hypothetical protein